MAKPWHADAFKAGQEGHARVVENQDSVTASQGARDVSPDPSQARDPHLPMDYDPQQAVRRPRLRIVGLENTSSGMVLGVLVLLAVLAMAGVAVQQHWVMDRQAEALREQARIMDRQLQQMQATSHETSVLADMMTRLAASGNVTAEAAQQAALAATQALHLTQRAYLTAQLPQTLSPLGQPFKVTSYFTNHGQSAAVNVSTTGGTATFQVPETLKIAFDNPRAQSTHATAPAMLPDADLELAATFPMGLSDDELKPLRTGHGVLAVFATAQYDDTFGAHHTTHACRLYLFDASTVQVGSQPCGAWNSAD